jgi:hypothetical protein
MSLRRWKNKLANAGKAVSSKVSGAVDAVKETTSEILDTSLPLEKAKKELADDLEKGIRIFDEIGLPQEVGDAYQVEIAEFAMKKLEEAFQHPNRKTD